MYRLYLNITTGGQTTQYDATDELRNWADVSLSYKRDGLSGVVRSFSTEFEFVGEARAALVAAFLADGVRADASVDFKTMADDYTFSTLFICALDFATLKYDAHRASINAVDNSIAAKLKAAKSQKYQYAVSGLTTQAATYKHLPMINNVQWFVNEWYNNLYDSQVTYLESSGTQYIDTGIVPVIGLDCEVDFSLLTTVNNQCVFGFQTSNTVNYHCTLFAQRWYWGSMTASMYNVAWPSGADTNRHKVRLDGQGNIYQDGTQLASNTTTANTATGNVYIFKRNSSDPASARMRCYGFTIKNGGQVVMDCVPVRVGSEGCMYDRVSGRLLRNSGTGAFALGADVSGTGGEKMYGSFYTRNGQPMATQLPLAYTGSEIAVSGTCKYSDVGRQYYKTNDLQDKLEPVFTAGIDCTVTLDFSISIGTPLYGTNTVSVWSLVVGKIETGEDGVKTLSALDTVDMLTTRDVVLHNDYAMKAGDSLVVYYIASGSEDDRVYFVINSDSMSVTYMAQDYMPVQIEALQPVTLMQALLDSICGAGNVTGAISTSDDRLQHTWLMAAESIRGIGDAQIYTSWTDFCGFMDAQFGYVPEIDEALQTVTFKERLQSVFDVTLPPAHTFTGDEAQDIEVSVSEDLLASKVSIGYEKQDYDSVNGRDEWRWVSEYSTGITNSENEVTLVCKYRADVYGIEFLTLTREEQTTDKDADEDIFLADLDTIGGVLTFRIDIPVSGIIAVNEMPNGRYTQRYMARANAFVLGRLTQSLIFTSIQGNQSAVVGGSAVTADVSLAGYAHVLPYRLTFVTPLQTVFNWKQRLAVVSGGHIYTGWVQDVRFGLGHDKVVTYTLLVNQIL